MNIKITAITLMLVISTQLVGCASSSKSTNATDFNAYKTGDSTLSCEQINIEIAEAERVQLQNQKEKTSEGAKLTASLILAPLGMLIDAADADNNNAIFAAAERKENMLKLAQSKGCK